jgi:lipopolysaccharide/colanic/teichoic acid biosynthesis glycosyltransferase
LFDILFSLLVILLFWPVYLIIAFLIRWDSPGPAIFKQQRVGEGGVLFTMYKFRTMIQDAEEKQNEFIVKDQNGNIIHKRPDDPRITKLGNFLRKTSLDELPQFYNVLIGDMSLVGPRPELPWLVEKYEPWQRKRFTVPQGITGWWQVNKRSEEIMHMSTKDDLYYVYNYSFWLDIRILVMTVGAMFRGF